MSSTLERKWWFAGPAAALAVLLTMFLMRSAGIGQPYGVAQWLLYFICVAGLQRGLSFAGWLLVVGLSPADKVRERTR